MSPCTSYLQWWPCSKRRVHYDPCVKEMFSSCSAMACWNLFVRLTRDMQGLCFLGAEGGVQGDEGLFCLSEVSTGVIVSDCWLVVAFDFSSLLDMMIAIYDVMTARRLYLYYKITWPMTWRLLIGWYLFPEMRHPVNKAYSTLIGWKDQTYATRFDLGTSSATCPQQWHHFRDTRKYPLREATNPEVGHVTTNMELPCLPFDLLWSSLWSSYFRKKYLAL